MTTHAPLPNAERYARLRDAVKREANGRVPCVEEKRDGQTVYRTWAIVGRGTRIEVVNTSAMEATADLLAELKAYRRRRNGRRTVTATPHPGRVVEG